MATSQQGSKQLQKMLSKASPDFVELALGESLSSFHKMMVDQYGNYFCQKLLQSSSSIQRLKILTHLTPHFISISCDRKGTHSMQCLIEMINMPEEQDLLRQAIEPHILDLAFDQNGTHVLQKVLISSMSEEHVEYITSMVLKNFQKLSVDQHGLCVVKKVISKVQKPESIQNIVCVICKNVIALVQDPFGNYAVQHAIEVRLQKVLNALRHGPQSTANKSSRSCCKTSFNFQFRNSHQTSSRR